MRVRTQLIVAFVGLAVIPMAGLTLYSYLSSIRAFRQAVHAEAASTASQMGERMRFRKSNLNRRLSRLSRVQFEELLGDRASDQAPVFYDSLVREMGSDASLLESLEFRPMAPPPSTSPPAPVAARASAPEVKSGQSARGSEKRARAEEEEAITIVLPVPSGREIKAAELEVSILDEVQRKLIIHRKDRMERREEFESAHAERMMEHRRDIEKATASPDYARDLNPSEIWVQKKSRSSLI